MSSQVVQVSQQLEESQQAQQREKVRAACHEGTKNAADFPEEHGEHLTDIQIIY